MASHAAHPVEVVALLAPALLHGRSTLGRRLMELLQNCADVRECKLEDGTPICPAVRFTAREAPGPMPGLERLKTVTWRVDGRTARHILVCFTPQEFVQAADDGLTSILHAIEAACPGHRLHLLTYGANSSCEAAAASWQLVADLAVWRPDVAFHNAADVDKAAEQVRRITRAVAEAEWKQTTVRSYLSVQQQSQAAQKKLERLETLLVRHGVQRGGNEAVLMRALLTLPGVGPEAAYSVGLQYGSLQELVEAAERSGAQEVEATIAGLPLPASNAAVGPAAAEKIVQLATLGQGG